MRDLPTVEEIMEELANRTAAHIDRRAPVAFEGALTELTRYHRFVLALNATESNDGSPFSYAQVSGAGWHAPHIDWIRQYRRLFQRGAERIPDEERFLEKLAYVPSRLLETDPGIRLSDTVMEGILGLQPMMMHAVEAWVTRRSIVESDGKSGAERTGLSGSDSRALGMVLPGIVGAWETILDSVSRRFELQMEIGTAPESAWSRFVSAWPFLRQHLANTTYCLAMAVWNGDKTGAHLFAEALIRWPGSGLSDVDHDGFQRFPWLMTPDLLESRWSVAQGRSARAEHRFLPDARPDGIFGMILDGAKRDMLLVTASTMVVWALGDDAVAGLAAITVRELVGGPDHDAYHDGTQALGFRGVIEGLIRLQMVGERYEGGTHGHWLDRQVSTIDNMREDVVVPGRIFTPTTMHSREELVIGDMALVAALAPEEGMSGIEQDLRTIAADEALLPAGDQSLRQVMMEMRRYREILEQAPPTLGRAILAVAPDADVPAAITRLHRVIDEIESAIGEVRRERLLARPVDFPTMEALRAAIEGELVRSPAGVPFFLEVETLEIDAEAEVRHVRIGNVSKGNLVRPELDWPSSNWTKTIADNVRQMVGAETFRKFALRPRKVIEAEAALDDPAFWSGLAPLIDLVGSDPILIVAWKDGIDRLSPFKLGQNKPLSELAISYESVPRERGRRMARIGEVDVFLADIPRGSAWLSSGRHLARIGFAPVDDGRVSLTFLPDDANPVIGALEIGYRPVPEWTEDPVFEIRLPN